jgi:hypothetical protein
MALNYAWKDQRILRFSREMLHLDEPWKDTKQINSVIDDLNRQQNEVYIFIGRRPYDPRFQV